MSGARGTTSDKPTMSKAMLAAAIRNASTPEEANQVIEELGRRQRKQQSKLPPPRLGGDRPKAPQVGVALRAPGTGGSGSSGVAQGQLEDVFTMQDQAILEYLDGVCNPWTEMPVRAPLVVGGFALETDTYQMVYEGEAIAGTDGVAWVEVPVSGWIEANANTGVPLEQYESYNIGVQGNVVWYSGSAAAPAVGFPAPGTASSAVIAFQVGRIVEASWDATTRMRITSVGLEVFSDSAILNAAGKIMICSSIRPGEVGAQSAGSLAINTFATIVTTPRKLVERVEVPLSGWESGKVLRAFAIPSEPAAFSLNELPTSGSIVTPHGVIGAIATGMVAGQTFSWRVVFNFESVACLTNRTNVGNPATIHAGLDRIGNSLPHLQPFATMGGPAIHLSKAPIAAHALANEMAITRPGHSKGLVALGKRPPTGGGFWNGVRDGAKLALSKVSDSGVLSKIPLIGGFMGTAAKAMSSLMNLF
jgi:hypothetical protein